MSVKEKVTVFICDFCGRDSDEVSAIVVTARHVAICNECVDACVKILAQSCDANSAASAAGHHPEHSTGRPL